MRRALLLLAAAAICGSVSNRCPSWCNVYTCSSSSCKSCSVCKDLKYGETCASWCNPYTTRFEVCAGCGPCEDHSADCAKDNIPGCFDLPEDSPVFDQCPLTCQVCTKVVGKAANPPRALCVSPEAVKYWMTGSDPVHLWHRCAEAMGDYNSPTLTYDTESEDGDGWCVGECTALVIWFPEDGYTIYTRSNQQVDLDTIPYACNIAPYTSAGCNAATGTFFEGMDCKRQSDSSFDTLQADCIEYFEYPKQENVLGDGCGITNITASYRDRLINESYYGPRYPFWDRDFIASPETLPLNHNVSFQYSCDADGALRISFWSNYPVDTPSCVGDADHSHKYYGNFYAAKEGDISRCKAEDVYAPTYPLPVIANFTGYVNTSTGKNLTWAPQFGPPPEPAGAIILGPRARRSLQDSATGILSPAHKTERPGGDIYPSPRRPPV